jgi:hypothetical protein
MTYIQHAVLREMAARGIGAVCLARMAWMSMNDILRDEGLALEVWRLLMTYEKEDSTCQRPVITTSPILAI